MGLSDVRSDSLRVERLLAITVKAKNRALSQRIKPLALAKKISQRILDKLA